LADREPSLIIATRGQNHIDARLSELSDGSGGDIICFGWRDRFSYQNITHLQIVTDVGVKILILWSFEVLKRPRHDPRAVPRTLRVSVYEIDDRNLWHCDSSRRVTLEIG
jgi:hypothetical protein